METPTLPLRTPAFQDLARAGRAVLVVLLLGVLPLAALVAFGIVALKPGTHETVDFHTFWVSSRAYAHRADPYPVVANLTWARDIEHSFYYPAPMAIVLAPLALLPFHTAAVIFVLVLAASVPTALWLVGVRDWRVYGVALLSPAVLTAISVGTLSPLLFLAVAAAWRWRNRPWLAAVSVGVAVLAKLFLWPLLLWLWFSGRRRAAGLAIVCDVIASVLAWAWIGFSGLDRYLTILRKAGTVEGPHSYALSWPLGGTPAVVLFALAGTSAVIGVSRSGRDSHAFCVAVVASLLITPILWLHYLAILLAPVAVLRPRFGWIWVLPLALWATPQQGASGEAWRLVVVVAVVVAVTIAALRANRADVVRVAC